MQFRKVKRLLIAQAVRRHPGDPDRAINEVEYLNDQARSLSPESDFVTVPTPVVARPPPPSPKHIPKPKKNEKSAIYANRQSTNGKKRDPDDSESEEVVSDGDSELDWSGDDGPKKKRRRGNGSEVDAEGEALKAFNGVLAEELTGTIGKLMGVQFV